MIRTPWTVARFIWVPNDGPLVVTLFDYLNQQIPIRSLYLSTVEVPITFTAVPQPPLGNPFYTATPPDGGNNPQTIPMPPGTTQVTLAASSAETHYVVAASGIYKPTMEGPSAQ